MKNGDLEARVQRLQSGGVVDLHFDLPMDLYEKRHRQNVLATDFLPECEAGGIRLLAAAIYLEDRYLRENALRVGLGQAAQLLREIDASDRFTMCRSAGEIDALDRGDKIGVLLALEGVEPIGEDLGLLRVFYELGLRLVGLTHARENAAASGAVFSASGSPARGLTAFGRELVEECERLRMIVDLAHLNPAGFDEVIARTKRPPVISHTNARKFYDIERNHADEQFRAVATKGGVIGVNTVLVSPEPEKASLDHYIDHFEHIISVVGIDHVAIGFDFFDFIYRQWSAEKQAEFHRKFRRVHSLPELAHHGQAANLTRRLIERGFADDQIEKILRGNWLRILRELL